MAANVMTRGADVVDGSAVKRWFQSTSAPGSEPGRVT
jgi:hypothetical protein